MVSSKVADKYFTIFHPEIDFTGAKSLPDHVLCYQKTYCVNKINQKILIYLDRSNKCPVSFKRDYERFSNGYVKF